MTTTTITVSTCPSWEYGLLGFFTLCLLCSQVFYLLPLLALYYTCLPDKEQCRWELQGRWLLIYGPSLQYAIIINVKVTFYLAITIVTPQETMTLMRGIHLNEADFWALHHYAVTYPL